MLFYLGNGYNKDPIGNKANTVFSLQDYMEKGIFVNLYDYMDADPNFRRGDYFENLFKAFEKDGKLYYIPLSYTVDTILQVPLMWEGGQTGH